MAGRNLLTAKAVKAAKSGDTLTDGGGLRCLVDKHSGNRWWQYRFKINGREYSISCGGHDVTLAQARAMRDQYESQKKAGRNPVLAGKLEKLIAKAPIAGGITFGQFASEYVEIRRGEWRNKKHAEQWLNPFKNHATSLLDIDIADVSLEAVLSVLEPIWSNRTDLANRMRQRGERIMAAAIVRGLYAGVNPFAWRGYLQELLPAPNKIHTVKHFEALPYAEAPAVWHRAAQSDAVSVDCFRFILLTAARSGEGRGAVWSEIDWDAKQWNLPGERMKAGKPHSVPLSPPALSILKRRLEVSCDTELIFPGMRGDNVLSDVAVSKSIKRYAGTKYTIHGLRSAFKDWAAEAGIDDLVTEICLAHQDRDKVRAAYLRTNLIESRRDVMAQWATFIVGEENND